MQWSQHDDVILTLKNTKGSKKNQNIRWKHRNLFADIFNNFNVLTSKYIKNLKNLNHTGKSLSEALIFASTNPQYDDRLFIELNYKFNTWKFQAQTWGENVVYRNCFWHTEQFLYTTCSPHVLQRFTCDYSLLFKMKWELYN